MAFISATGLAPVIDWLDNLINQSTQPENGANQASEAKPFSSISHDAIVRFKTYLRKCFYMKDLGVLKYILDIEVARNPEKTEKQPTKPRSLVKAEYRLKAVATCELKWLKTLLFSLGVGHSKSMQLFCDSQSALHIAKNLVFHHDRTKPIEAKPFSLISHDAIVQFKTYLCKCLYMKDLGVLKYILGIEVARSPEGIFLSQRKYALDILTEAGMLVCKPIDTPMEQNHRLAHASGEPFAHPDQYCRLVGRLVYLSVTGPELSYSVHVRAQFLSDPQASH
ncbi:uncharacterized protein LOC110714674 [Chenopodium quinoa]|uniref:uncharacterized protein LOC110714674 n=1 Tax=Chenopodium quinoa TaxID=63459 RepID=UPI000B79ADAB|nr:uncharacterized protein LOC110714674 [Chenopodium quinoa]